MNNTTGVNKQKKKLISSISSVEHLRRRSSLQNTNTFDLITFSSNKTLYFLTNVATICVISLYEKIYC